MMSKHAKTINRLLNTCLRISLKVNKQILKYKQIFFGIKLFAQGLALLLDLLLAQLLALFNVQVTIVNYVAIKDYTEIVKF